MSISPSLTIAIILGACCALLGCDVGPPHAVTSKTLEKCGASYADTTKRLRLEKALEESKVPYESVVLADGQLGVQAHGENCVKFQETMLSLFGANLPNGRNMHFDDEHQDQFKKWLTERGIPFQIEVRDGSEFVVWAADDSARVTAWEHFPKVGPFLGPSTSNITVNPDAPSAGRLPSR